MKLRTGEGLVSQSLGAISIHYGSIFVYIRKQWKLEADLLVCRMMKLEHQNVSAADVNPMDRQVIRVDVPPAHAGITAALRRAFQAAASDPCDREFADLIRRLN